MATMETDAPARPTLDTDLSQPVPSQVFYRTVKINALGTKAPEIAGDILPFLNTHAPASPEKG